jgi:aspartate kinase
MSIIVQKYGGSSVADVGKLRSVAERVMQTARRGHQVVVVVSAMGDTTDELLAMAKQLSPNPERRELDMLLSAGERISMALLSLAIRELGGDAISFTGSQSGIITNDRHVDARIIEVRPFRVQDELARGRIVVIAGYQGVSYKREVTTLGRGGSDTTAVAMAAALDAEYCEICSDVDGVYSADPRVVPAAERIGTLSYEETQEMAEAGAKVLNAQAVEFAKEKGIAIYARATQGPLPGPTRPRMARWFARARRGCRARSSASPASGICSCWMAAPARRRARAARRAPRPRQTAARVRRPHDGGDLAREPARRGTAARSAADATRWTRAAG